VVEFVLPRYDAEFEPVPARTFVDALRARVNAVVFTRFPVHPFQCHTFNDALYRVLAEGGSIEAAVQQGRTEVQKNEFLGDAAAFASFALVTGPQSDMRLVPAKSPDPLAGGAKQPSVEPTAATTPQTARDVTFTRT
jgi:hypothetical protein